MSTEKDTKTLKRGVCKNPECDMCMSREVQEVEPGADFVCSECGMPLQEIPQKKTTPNPTGKYVGIAIAAAIILGVVAYFLFGKGDNHSTEPVSTVVPPTDTVKVDTVVKVDTITKVNTITVTDTVVVDVEKPQPNGKFGTVNLSYGRYKGPLSNGKPDGMGGEFVFTKACTIDLKEGNGNTVAVAPNDKIISTKFDNGVLTQGEIVFSNGSKKYITGVRQKL